jgi:hypothetical protein
MTNTVGKNNYRAQFIRRYYLIYKLNPFGVPGFQKFLPVMLYKY